jgi:TrmH family RNA methyltransferase
MTKPETIASASNPLLKDVRRAIGRGGLTQEGYLVAETFHLLEEALRSNCAVKVVLCSASVQSAVESHVKRLTGMRVAVVSDQLFPSISGTEASQGVIALVEPPIWNLPQLFRGRSLVVVLDGLQDPGNAGAIARAAEAFGATGIMFLKGTVSPFNPKALRAAAGSLFRVPFAYGLDAALARAALQQNKLDVYASVPSNSQHPSKPLGEVDFGRRCAIVVGNEARGVSPQLRAHAIDISIPTIGVESLNAAVAAGILLYESRRQRSLSV